MSTTFTTIVDESDYQEWPDSTAHLETRIDGDLADRIRARTGKTGDVILIEDGIEGGYSEYTVEWDWDAQIAVDGQTVWSHASESSEVDKSGDPERAYWGALPHLIAWLDDAK